MEKVTGTQVTLGINGIKLKIRKPSFEVQGARNTQVFPETRSRSAFLFFLVVFALSIPFWLIGALSGYQPIDGLPVSALMTFCPLSAAVILTYRESRNKGVKKLLKRIFDFRRTGAGIWYVSSVLLMPGASILTYLLMRLMRFPLPSPEFPLQTSLIMFFVFFAGAVCEEGGWMGYVVDRMQLRGNALLISILLGVVTAVWHVIPFVEAGRSLSWIVWQCLFIVASRVLIVWIYNNTGRSVFTAVLYHTMINMSSFLFPNLGSHYNPQITSLVVTFAAVVVAAVWGPKKLRRRDR
jgi:membrane protease YdiL (CAAX protease family)